VVSKPAQSHAPGADYACDLALAASPTTVFSALTTLRGLRGWWTPSVTGSPAGGELLFRFPGLKEQIIMRVDLVTPPSEVRWTCIRHDSLPDWAGTTANFLLHSVASNQCVLGFRHAGLTPRLDCYDECAAGWNHFLASLRAYVEDGRGTPFGS
jgi:uncharacterized protein YndB with AHSA1/START domain